MTKQITKTIGLFGLATTLLSALNLTATPAGILFVSKDPKGTVRVLLGRESMGLASDTWCDFGGASDPGETTCQTACREAAEETRAYFRPSGTRSWAKQASIQHLSKKQHFGCITQHWNGSRGYHMYVVPVPYFTNEDQKLKNGAYPDYEKNKFRWVSLPGLLRDINQGQNFYLCNDGTQLPLRTEFLGLLRDSQNSKTMQRIFANCQRVL